MESSVTVSLEMLLTFIELRIENYNLEKQLPMGKE